MVLREITIRYISRSEQTKEKEIKAKTIKAGSIPRKQNEIISQNSKKFLKNIAASGFAVLK